MSKTVWIINQYASTPATGMGGRHYYLGKELAKLGYKVYLVASATHHLLREKPVIEHTFKVEKLAEGVHFVWINMPHYAEAHSKQRVLNWLLFSWRIQTLARLQLAKPDTILVSSPSPFSFLGAQLLARKFKARLIFEVRDIWPLTLTEIGGYSKNNLFIRFMQWVEDKAYRDADAVVSNLRNAVEHMASRGMERNKFKWIPNGFSLDEVNQKLPLNDKAISLLPKDKFVVGYTGTLGKANALGTLIEAASRLRGYHDINFVIVGGGKDKISLQGSVQEKRLKNVIFIDPIPKVEIQSMLSRFDICYIGWLKDDLYRFGIGANKIPEYLYSRKPILHAYSGDNDPIADANAGIQISAEDPEQLSEAVLKLYYMSIEARYILGENGRAAALRQYEYGQLAQQLVKVIFPS